MSSPAHILCFGRNPVLLETRCAVLAKRYDAVPISSLEQMGQISPSRPFDLVLFCHTLSADECRAGVEIARHRWPESKILGLTSDTAKCTETDADQRVSCLDGPRALLAAVRDLIQPDSVAPGNSASI